MVNSLVFVGDVHGYHDRMVSSVLAWGSKTRIAIERIICLGDFEGLIDKTDMLATASPPKHRTMGDYAAYYHGEKGYPADVLFIGGNHDAYNRLSPMPQGGVYGPRCSYLGRFGTATLLGLRIAGLSGVYSPKVFAKGRREVNYGDPQTLASRAILKQAAYFTQDEVTALASIGSADVLIMHDWPALLSDLASPGSMDGTPRRIGLNQPGLNLLRALKPRWLFCGHMHWYFRGEIAWPEGQRTTFVCLDKVQSPRGPFMASLIKEELGTISLEVIPPDPCNPTS